MITLTLASWLAFSPLLETMERAPLWGTSGFDIFDTNDLFYACIRPGL